MSRICDRAGCGQRADDEITFAVEDTHLDLCTKCREDVEQLLRTPHSKRRRKPMLSIGGNKDG